MPVEIRELVIRAVVGEPVTKAGESAAEGAAAPHEAASTSDIVQECVRQVLRILQKKEER